MQIQKVTLKNWRSVQQETVFLEELMVFVGKNNHGKSNILRGIEFFFTQRNATEKDFWKKSDSLSLEITFHLLSEEEKEQWKEYLNEEGNLMLRKEQKKGEEAEYVSASNPPQSPLLRGEDVWNIFHVLRLSSSKKASSHDVFQALFTEMISRLLHKNRNIFRENLGIAAKEWGIDMELSNNGGIENKTLTALEKEQNGLLRALFFSLFYSFSRLQSTQTGNKKVLFLWEEPELFLHPQAQSELYFCLKRCLKSNMNIFFTTHSSSFVDLTRHKSICIVHKELVPNADSGSEEKGTKGKQVRGNLFSKDERKSFNMGYWINPDRGELFFAKKVILVEGPTEKILLPKLAKELGISHYETAIIDCAGKTNMPLYITLLNAFKIPYSVVYDLDQHGFRNRNSREEAKRQSHFLEKKVRKEIGKAIAMENDIEEELGITDRRKRKKPFLAINFLEQRGFQISWELEQKMRRIFE